MSNYLYIKMLFIDFQGSLKETRVQRSPGHVPRVTVMYRFDCSLHNEFRVFSLLPKKAPAFGQAQILCAPGIAKTRITQAVLENKAGCMHVH